MTFWWLQDVRAEAIIFLSWSFVSDDDCFISRMLYPFQAGRMGRQKGKRDMLAKFPLLKNFPGSFTQWLLLISYWPRLSMAAWFVRVVKSGNVVFKLDALPSLWKLGFCEEGKIIECLWYEQLEAFGHIRHAMKEKILSWKEETNHLTTDVFFFPLGWLFLFFILFVFEYSWHAMLH